MIKQNSYNESLVANIDKANQFYGQFAVYYSEFQSTLDSVKIQTSSAEYRTVDYCGGVYTGFTFNNRPWGKGTFTSKSGCGVFADFYGFNAIGENVKVEGNRLYSGELTIASGEIKLHGYGKLIGSDTTVQGNFSYGILHGLAKVIHHETNEIYEGIFVYGNRDGHGKLTRADGSFIEGTWNEEGCSALVKIRFVDGSVFTGLQSEGKPMMGKLEYATGDIYEGSLHSSGLPLGDGQLTTKMNFVITGFFWKGNVSSGVLQWPDGRITKVLWAEKYECIIAEDYYHKYQAAIDNGAHSEEEIEKHRITV